MMIDLLLDGALLALVCGFAWVIKPVARHTIFRHEARRRR